MPLSSENLAWAMDRAVRLLAGSPEGEESFGVHITYEQLYAAIIFLVCIYIGGQIASRLLRMPNLVGEIIVGILLGPPLANYVPFAEAWVLFGEIGYVVDRCLAVARSMGASF